MVIFTYIFCNTHLITLNKGKSHKVLLFTQKCNAVFSLLPEPCFSCFSLWFFHLHWSNLESTDVSHLPKSSVLAQWKRLQWRSLLLAVDKREVWSWPYLETVWHSCRSGGKSLHKNKFHLCFVAALNGLKARQLKTYIISYRIYLSIIVTFN